MAKRGLRPGAGRLHFRTASRRYKTVWIQRKTFPRRLPGRVARAVRRGGTPALEGGNDDGGLPRRRRFVRLVPRPVFLTGFGTARAGSGRAVGQRHRHDGWRIFVDITRLSSARHPALARLVQRRYGDWAIGCLALLSWPTRKTAGGIFARPLSSRHRAGGRRGAEAGFQADGQPPAGEASCRYCLCPDSHRRHRLGDPARGRAKLSASLGFAGRGDHAPHADPPRRVPGRACCGQGEPFEVGGSVEFARFGNPRPARLGFATTSRCPRTSPTAR